jgi:hypothetical protein
VVHIGRKLLVQFGRKSLVHYRAKDDNYASGQRIAMRSGSAQPQWLISDHMGSTSKVANYDGSLFTSQLYKPWGYILSIGNPMDKARREDRRVGAWKRAKRPGGMPIAARGWLGWGRNRDYRTGQGAQQMVLQVIVFIVGLARLPQLPEDG